MEKCLVRTTAVPLENGSRNFFFDLFLSKSYFATGPVQSEKDICGLVLET